MAFIIKVLCSFILTLCGVLIFRWSLVVVIFLYCINLSPKWSILFKCNDIILEFFFIRPRIRNRPFQCLIIFSPVSVFTKFFLLVRLRIFNMFCIVLVYFFSKRFVFYFYPKKNCYQYRIYQTQIHPPIYPSFTLRLYFIVLSYFVTLLFYTHDLERIYIR